MYYDKRIETEPMVQPVAPVQLEPWRQDLLDAAQYIRDHGWCQHTFGNVYGNVCIYGAFRRLTSWENTHKAALALVARLGCDVVAWNDSPGRTQAEVIALLGQVART